ncbi:MAG: hypothetical protein ABH803_02545 [Candidatus Micrarchaeota archaeon]
MPELIAIAVSFLYYALFLVGGVSIGYFVMRLSFPDVRLLEKTEKTGLSALVGALLLVAAIAVDYLVSGVNVVLSTKGLFPLIVSVLITASFLVLRLWFSFLKPRVLVIGIPAAKSSLKGEIMGLVDDIKHEPIPIVEAKKIEEKTEPLVEYLPPTEKKKKEVVQDAPQPHEWFNGLVSSIASVFSKKSMDKSKQNAALRDIKELNAPASLSVQEDVELGKQERRRLKEVEVELMIKDVVKIDEKKPDERHRRYMQKEVITPEEAQKQVKESARKESLTDKVSVNVPPKPVEPIVAQPVSPTTSASKKLFADLSAISSGKPKEVELVKAEGPGSCPRCKSKNSRIIFCPYCGSAMCANCTLNLTPTENGFEYVCPNCSETVLVKKKT